MFGNVKQLSEVTLGFWQNFYTGPLGRIAYGVQIEYILRSTFPGTGQNGAPVSPATNQAAALTSLRYYFP